MHKDTEIYEFFSKNILYGSCNSYTNVKVLLEYFKNGLGHDLSLKILNFILPNLMTTE